MPRRALLLAYDGSAFAGWWRQSGRRSVARELDAAFARIGEAAAAPVGASRTDAGVHARGQVAHVDLARDREPAALVAALARHLPDDCTCRAAATVADGWHAVHDATGKTYSYAIDNGAVADPFAARVSWRPPFRLELAALQDLAIPIPGERDWSAFARRGDHRDDHRRRVSAVSWRMDGERLVCIVDGDGFTYRLVRSLVGAMVACAQGTCSRDDLLGALAGKRTPAAAQQAPARGLCLERVRYSEEPAWDR